MTTLRPAPHLRPDREPTPDERYAVPEKSLIEILGGNTYQYKCPHCGEYWDAGNGRKVGFVVASLNRHVLTCQAVSGVMVAFNLDRKTAKRKRLALWRAYREQFDSIPDAARPYPKEGFSRFRPPPS